MLLQSICAVYRGKHSLIVSFIQKETFLSNIREPGMNPKCHCLLCILYTGDALATNEAVCNVY